MIVFEPCYDTRINDLHSDEVWPVSGQNMYNVTPATLSTGPLCTYRSGHCKMGHMSDARRNFPFGFLFPHISQYISNTLVL